MLHMLYASIVQGASTIICWNSRCRFELAIFSVLLGRANIQDAGSCCTTGLPWQGSRRTKRPTSLSPSAAIPERVFLRAIEPFHEAETLPRGHEERPGAPGTLLAENFLDTNLRAWDFTSGLTLLPGSSHSHRLPLQGEAFRSTHPMIFSYSDDPRSKRVACPAFAHWPALAHAFCLRGGWALRILLVTQDFMNISTSKMERQQFDHPGEGGILGMGPSARSA